MAVEVLTGLLVAITAFYAWVNFRILKANREQVEALLRPYVTIRTLALPKNPIIYLSISNTGKSSADNLRLAMDRDFYQFSDTNRTNLADLHIFKNEIQCLPPGTELVFMLERGFMLFGENNDPKITPLQFTITATYSYPGRRVQETTTIDLETYRAVALNTDALIDQLEKIRDSLTKLGNVG